MRRKTGRRDTLVGKRPASCARCGSTRIIRDGVGCQDCLDAWRLRWQVDEENIRALTEALVATVKSLEGLRPAAEDARLWGDDDDRGVSIARAALRKMGVEP